MAYIVVVNPGILASPETGMAFTGVLTATVLIALALASTATAIALSTIHTLIEGSLRTAGRAAGRPGRSGPSLLGRLGYAFATRTDPPGGTGP